MRFPQRPGPSLSARSWLALCLSLCLWLAPLAHAQQETAPADVQQTLDEARERIDKARATLEKEGAGDADLAALDKAMREVGSDAEAAIEALTPQLASVQARLEELGPASEDVDEAPDIARQRKELQASHAALDGQLKLARLLVVESEQVAGQITAQRRAGFQARLGERTAALFDGGFWRQVREELPADLARLESLAASFWLSLRALPGALLAELTAVALAVIALRWWLGRLLFTLIVNGTPSARLRRSLRAVAVVALSTGTPVLLLVLMHVLLERGAPGEAGAGETLGSLTAAFAFGGFVVGLGQALLSPQRPTWRLPAVPDLLARRARWLPWGLAVVLVGAWLAERVLGAIDASLLVVVLLNAGIAVALCLVLAVALWQGERVRLKARRAPDEVPGFAPPWWLSLLVICAWLVLGFCALCLVTGYVALASFAARQLAWSVVVLGAAYLLATFVDDLLRMLAGGEDESPHESRRAQVAVLLGGLARVGILLGCVALLLASFEQGPGDVVARFALVARGITIGAVTLRPVALLHAALTFVVCLAVVSVLKRWLAERFLPTTGMDEGMRDSAATLFGYVGAVVAVALALIAAGIGLERVAWVASALSVGIGFGLQAVVQNFVCGLILLAERPVRVGDWVAIGGVEGDIRRINARATEIQMGDQSTLIVPNSEFITKTVRNVTHTNAKGLVNFKLPLPLDADPGQVRDIVLDVFARHEDVLPSPAPAVFIDSIDARSIVFSATGYVASPRIAYRTRSALLFEIVSALRAAGVRFTPAE